MAAATFKVEHKAVPNTDGTTSVRIRITRSRLHAYLNLGIRITVSENERKSEWNTRYEDRRRNWIKGHRKAATFNQEIEAALDKLDALAKAHPTLSAKGIKQKYEDQPAEQQEINTSFVSYVRELEQRFRAAGRVAYAEQLRFSLQRMEAFAGDNVSDERVLTPYFISTYVTWLREQTRKHSTEKRFSPKTISVYLKALQNAFTKGIEEGKLVPVRSPFAGLDLYVPSKKQARPEVQTVLSLFDADLSGKPEWHHARNTFLLLFLLHGGRVSEVVQLEWEKVTDQHVSYLPSKRSAKWKTVPRHELINRILSQYHREGRYVLPWLPDTFHALTKNEQYVLLKEVKDRINTALCGISRRLKLPRLTTHMARRVFTDEALKTLNVREVQHLVGWASVTMAERYAEELRQEELNKASGSIFDRLSGKH